MGHGNSGHDQYIFYSVIVDIFNTMGKIRCRQFLKEGDGGNHRPSTAQVFLISI